MIIGVDPNTSVHVASALDTTTQRVGGLERIEASLAGYRQLLRWAARFDERRWAVENARGLGRHLTQWLVARGEFVTDVPSTATARVRELSRGRRRKNDLIDAAAAASVAALGGEGDGVDPDGITEVLALLDERRSNLVTGRTRLVNQVHAVLRDLLPGGARTGLTAAAAARLLAGVRPVGPVETARKHLARDLLAEVRDVDRRIKTSPARSPRPSPTPARACRCRRDRPGAGRPAARPYSSGQSVPDAAAFANYAGVAPVEIASAEQPGTAPRGGDRQLNLTLHIAALTQVRMTSSLGRAYYDAKIAAGKTHNGAMRCLKRRLADRAWRSCSPTNDAGRRAREDTRGRLCNPARLAQPRPPALRTSHFPNPPTTDSTTPRPAA